MPSYYDAVASIAGPAPRRRKRLQEHDFAFVRAVLVHDLDDSADVAGSLKYPSAPNVPHGVALGLRGHPFKML